MLFGSTTRLLTFARLGIALGALLAGACAHGVDSLADFGPPEGSAGGGFGASGGPGVGVAGAPSVGGGAGASGDAAGSSGGGMAGAGTTGGSGGPGGQSFDGSGGSGSVAPDASVADRFDSFALDAQERVLPPGDAVSDADCPGAGTALSFDRARSSTVVIPGGSLPLGSGARTIEMWVLSKSPQSNWASDHSIFEYGGRNDLQAFGLDLDVFPMLELYVIPLNKSLFFNSGAVQDKWFHVASTYDGNATHAFVDGIEKGALVVGAIATTASSLYIGSGVARNYWTGSIDEVRVWNVARSQTEIQGNMNVRLSGNEPGLVGYWRFDEGAGTSTQDSSGGGHPGVLTSGPSWLPSPVALGCK